MLVSKRFIGLGVALLVAAGSYYFLIQDVQETEIALMVSQPTQAVQEKEKKKNISQQETPLALSRAEHEAYQELQVKLQATSLMAGTAIDGVLQVDSNHHLIVNLQLRDWLDYFLLATHQLSQTEVDQLVALEAKRQLPHEALQQLIKIWDDYQSYKVSMAQMMDQQTPQYNTTEQDYQAYIYYTLQDTFEKINDLRLNTFSQQQVQGLFSEEIAYENFTLAKLDIIANDSLSEVAKTQAFIQAINQLPEEIREVEHARFHQEQAQRKQQQVLKNPDLSKLEKYQALIDLGIDVQRVYQIISVQERREAFAKRRLIYEEKKQQLLSQAQMSEVEKNQRIEALIEETFPTDLEREVVRVDAR